MLARLAAIALAGALFCFGHASWIEAKAILAQFLIEDAWTGSLTTDQAARPWYWADTWPVARLRSSKLPRDLFVLAGADGSSLAFGPGHLNGTGLLTGEGGPSVIAGHRDTHFRFLRYLTVGDAIEIQNERGLWTSYKVDAAFVIDAHDFLLDPDIDVYLTTCYPFDAVTTGGPLRYIVALVRS